MSTTTTLLEISDEIYQGTEKNMFTSVMALDQTSAFDCISHRLLLEKLWRYKVGPQACEWVRQYLESRTQYVVIGTAQSRMIKVHSGVPQGSVIGPLSYAIYTNELSEIVKSPICQDQKVTLIPVNYLGDNAWNVESSLYMLTIPHSQCQIKLDNPTQTKLRICLDEISLLLMDNQLLINQPKMSITECMIGQKKGEDDRLTS